MIQLFLYEPEAIPRTTKTHSMLKIAFTLGQVGVRVCSNVLSSVTKRITRPQVSLLTGLQLSVFLSESSGRQNTLQGM